MTFTTIDDLNMFSRLTQLTRSQLAPFLRLLGLDDENFSIVLLIAFCSVGVGVILIVTHGNILATAFFLAAASIILITFYRLDWGFFLLIGMVLIFDQFLLPGFEPYTLKLDYFRNVKEISYLPTFDWAVVNPLELQLVLLSCVWIILVAVKKNVMLNRVPAWGAALIFFVWLAVSFAYGMRRGGDFLPALWEMRALFYLGVMYFLVPQIIQTRGQLQTFFWVCIIAISFKALQGIVRFVQLGFSFHGRPTLTNHEDPLFFVTLFVLLLALVLFGGQPRQRRVLMWLLFPLIVGFIAAQRRAAYGAAFVSFVTFVVLLPRKERWMLLKVMLPVVVVLALYVAIFWNSNSKIASPVRLLATSFSTDRETNPYRYHSNLYRKYENYNLASTVRKAPFMGIGFGRKYDAPIRLADIPFPLRDYIPHNEILWLLVKTGAVGFFLFWFFFNSFVSQGASLLSRLKDPYLKAVCAVAVVAVVSQIVVSYFDLQLTYYRNMVYLGALMGLLPTLGTIEKSLSVTPGDAHRE